MRSYAKQHQPENYKIIVVVDGKRILIKPYRGHRDMKMAEANAISNYLHDFYRVPVNKIIATGRFSKAFAAFVIDLLNGVYPKRKSRILREDVLIFLDMEDLLSKGLSYADVK